MNVLPPVRVRREYVQKIHAPPAAVFPMLCPVREVEWAGGWNPGEVYTSTGLIEPQCVFTTREGEAEAIWMVTRYDSEKLALEMVKVTPGLTAARLEIALTAAGEGTAARVAYTHTALSAAGRDFVEAFTEERFGEFMRTWERELNHYLETGGPLDLSEPRYE